MSPQEKVQTALFSEALYCKNEQKRPPIWIMRQAGRYMPEYKKIRAQYDFWDMCRIPEIASEVTLLPINLLDVDAAVLFSDILLIVEALGRGVSFEDKIGPVIDRPITCERDIDLLPQIAVEEKLSFITEIIHNLKGTLKVPLIGLCGGPFTVASYLIEGMSSKTLKLTKKWAFQQEASFHKLLDKIADLSIEFINLQIDAGADAVQIFDSWANFLAYPQFLDFSLRYLNKICNGIKDPNFPLILFAKGSSIFAKELATTSAKALSIDWNAHLPDIRQIVGPQVALQGNLDPFVLYGNKETITREAKKLLHDMEGDKGFIFNLGHGVLPDLAFDNVRHLVDLVKSHA